MIGFWVGLRAAVRVQLHDPRTQGCVDRYLALRSTPQRRCPTGVGPPADRVAAAGVLAGVGVLGGAVAADRAWHDAVIRAAAIDSARAARWRRALAGRFCAARVRADTVITGWPPIAALRLALSRRRARART